MELSVAKLSKNDFMAVLIDQNKQKLSQIWVNSAFDSLFLYPLFLVYQSIIQRSNIHLTQGVHLNYRT